MKCLAFLGPLAGAALTGHAAFAQYSDQPPAGAYGSAPSGTYGSAPPPSSQPPIESGGLAPPPSTSTESPEVVQTEAKLDEAEKKDSGRGLEWFWVNAEFGFEHLGLQTFHANNLVDSAVVGTTQTGLLYGAGLGVRLVFVTLGAKFRIGTFSDYDIWTLNAEAGLRIPLGNIEPHLLLGAGFASLGSFAASDIGGVNRSSVNVNGYDIRAGGGIDYYVTPIFSVGAAATFEMLGLSRASVKDVQAVANGGNVPASTVYNASGSSIGSGFTGTLVLGLHF